MLAMKTVRNLSRFWKVSSRIWTWDYRCRLLPWQEDHQKVLGLWKRHYSSWGTCRRFLAMWTFSDAWTFQCKTITHNHTLTINVATSWRSSWVGETASSVRVSPWIDRLPGWAEDPFKQPSWKADATNSRLPGWPKPRRRFQRHFEEWFSKVVEVCRDGFDNLTDFSWLWTII